MTLIPAPTWLSVKETVNQESNGPDPTGPTIVTNDIDGAFNLIIHYRLIEIMYHYRLPTDLIGNICSFTQTGTISMSFEGKTDPPTPFTSGLPHGSPLS